MPRLQIELSEKEIADLVDGKKVSLGKLGECWDVYLVKEKANDLHYSKGLEREHKPKEVKPSTYLTSLYYNGEQIVYLCPGYKCYLTNSPLDDSVGEDGDLNMFGHGNSFKVNGKWEYCILKPELM